MYFFGFVIILVEINAEGVSLEMCKKVSVHGAKSHNWPIVKDIGHF